MIERQSFDGRGASVQYLTAGMRPAGRDAAELVLVVFDDGERIWLQAPADPSDLIEDRTADIDFVEAEHPRGQPGNAGQFVKGAGSRASAWTGRESSGRGLGQRLRQAGRAIVRTPKAAVLGARTVGESYMANVKRASEHDLHLLKSGAHKPGSKERKHWAAKLRSIAKTMPHLLRRHWHELKDDAVASVGALNSLRQGKAPTKEQAKGVIDFAVKVAVIVGSIATAGHPIGLAVMGKAFATEFAQEAVQHVAMEHMASFGTAAARFLGGDQKHPAPDDLGLTREDYAMLQALIEALADVIEKHPLDDDDAGRLLAEARNGEPGNDRV